MKISYTIIKLWLRTGLFFYYREIRVIGKDNIPKDKPIMLLANHQNALIDPLVIATSCGLKPYFLARSDLFKNTVVSKLLNYLQMMPIYRLRDGIGTLKNNPAIFKKCGELLVKGKTVMLFPEGNHGIQRRVRLPMRKGFTKMIFSALEERPNLDIRILPVGLNYGKAESFPDSVALCIGKDFAVQDYYDPADLKGSEAILKEVVFKNLKKLTTHIHDENTYDNVLTQLNNLKVDYLKPKKVNRIIKDIDPNFAAETEKIKTPWPWQLVRILFVIINFPMIVLWRKVLKPQITDLEFMATLRFLLSLVIFPVFYLSVYLLTRLALGQEIALTVFLTYIVFNLVYVKLN
ncbi:MAG: 1-acyl-sn-glycerol-3-phosphate acyltransferase [Maribacter sp.]|nr:1-acyl-sn-glycerol-3-phosphate acyltransferase [Maribacter sp.]